MTQTFDGVETVLLDLDDTLWENNLYFLQSINWLCRVGRSHGHTDRATVALLNKMEDENIPHRGFGYDSYEASYLGALRILTARSGRGTDHPGLRRLARAQVNYLRSHPIRWLPGVPACLELLHRSFRVIAVTKGHRGDQTAKVERCGLKHLFHAVKVLPHKHVKDYLGLLEEFTVEPASAVMVGNSPKSDINMPKRAGLRTIYIPHVLSWFREMEHIETDGPPTIEVEAFPDVLPVLGLPPLSP